MSDGNNGNGPDPNIIPLGQMGYKKKVDDLEAEVEKLSSRVSALEKQNEHHAAVNLVMAEKYAALRDLVVRAVQAINVAEQRLLGKKPNGE